MILGGGGGIMNVKLVINCLRTWVQFYRVENLNPGCSFQGVSEFQFQLIPNKKSVRVMGSLSGLWFFGIKSNDSL